LTREIFVQIRIQQLFHELYFSHTHRETVVVALFCPSYRGQLQSSWTATAVKLLGTHRQPGPPTAPPLHVP